jgi:hypothetical protein
MWSHPPFSQHGTPVFFNGRARSCRAKKKTTGHHPSCVPDWRDKEFKGLGCTSLGLTTASNVGKLRDMCCIRVLLKIKCIQML